jgi:hypothetical protein
MELSMSTSIRPLILQSRGRKGAVDRWPVSGWLEQVRSKFYADKQY